MSDKEKADLAPVVGSAKVTLEQGLARARRTASRFPANSKSRTASRSSPCTRSRTAPKYFEVIVDQTSGEIAKTEPIIRRTIWPQAKKQNDGLFRATRELSEAVKEAKHDNPGYLAVSVWSEMKDNHSIATVTLGQRQRLEDRGNRPHGLPDPDQGLADRPARMFRSCRLVGRARYRADADTDPAGGGAEPRRHRLGKRLYQEKATCGFCHGWSGDGAGDPQSPGKAANLRETKLDHDQLVEVHPLRRPRRHRDAAFRQVRLDRGRGVLRHDGRRCRRQEAAAARPPAYRSARSRPSSLISRPRLSAKVQPTVADCEDYFGQGSLRCKEMAAGRKE